jgi:hypothetical protein
MNAEPDPSPGDPQKDEGGTKTTSTKSTVTKPLTNRCDNMDNQNSNCRENHTLHNRNNLSDTNRMTCV